jgi:Pyridoxamine 5'-phosphate oxidase
MGKAFDSIDQELRAFITAQRVFFVATAPSMGGHVNLSPKGLDSLRIIDERTIAYIDYVGSGAETIAHVKDNGRIVLMVCAFEGAPKIVRVHGRGEAVEPHDPQFDALRALFDSHLPARSIINITIERISDSCGYGVPLYAFRGDRTQLEAWTERKGEQGLLEYQKKNNRLSLDGLPALRWTQELK